MLTLSAVSARYGSVPAISDISITVGEGEAVGLLGANGAGKSTTLRAISGLIRLTSGTVTFFGQDLAALPPHKIAALGIAHVPEGRQVFPELTVNGESRGRLLHSKRQSRAQSHTRSRIRDLSGSCRTAQSAGRHHERRRTADARGRPRFDAQTQIADAGRALARARAGRDRCHICQNSEVHAMGTAILLVEQNVSRALSMVQRAYVLESGKVIIQGSSAELANNKQVQVAYLGM